MLQILLNTYSLNPTWRDPFKHLGLNQNVVVHCQVLLHVEMVGQYSLLEENLTHATKRLTSDLSAE